jgi:hypothetical protein
MTRAITGVVGDKIAVGATNGTVITNGTEGATTNGTTCEDDEPAGIIYVWLFDEPLLRGRQRRVKCFLHRALDRTEQKTDTHDFELEFLLRLDGTCHVRLQTKNGFTSIGYRDNRSPGCWTDVGLLDGRLSIGGGRSWIRFVIEEEGGKQTLNVFFELRPQQAQVGDQDEATRPSEPPT